MAGIKDVAAKAGLSVGTVSRVLNNRGYISEKTRRLVYEVMRELDYSPSEVARSLCLGRTTLLAMLIPTVRHGFFAELAEGAELAATAAGYKLLLCNSSAIGAKGESRYVTGEAKEYEYLDMVRRNLVGGIIIMPSSLDVTRFIDEKNLPMVALERAEPGVPYIGSDHVQGARLGRNR